MTILQTSIATLATYGENEVFTLSEFWQRTDRFNCRLDYHYRYARDFLESKRIAGNVAIVGATHFGDCVYQKRTG